jgi:hypothetical protein
MIVQFQHFSTTLVWKSNNPQLGWKKLAQIAQQLRSETLSLPVSLHGFEGWGGRFITHQLIYSLHRSKTAHKRAMFENTALLQKPLAELSMSLQDFPHFTEKVTVGLPDLAVPQMYQLLNKIKRLRVDKGDKSAGCFSPLIARSFPGVLAERFRGPPPHIAAYVFLIFQSAPDSVLIPRFAS